MRDKTAQTATEYLIILAVVIVIALIVVGVLGGIPSIGGSTSTSANDAKLKTSKVAVVSHSVTNEGTKVVIRNNQADTIKVSALDINGTACSSSDLPSILPAGISKEVLCTNIRSLIREDVFEFPLIINYTDTKTNSNYVLDDDLKLIGRVGHKTVTIWAETLKSTVEINDSTMNGPVLINSDYYGYSIANIGDLNLDGVNDIAVGAPFDDTDGDRKGVLYLHLMNSNGSIKSTMEINDSTINGPVLNIWDQFGSSITSLGDLDGDGVDDIVVGASGKNSIFISFMNLDNSIKSTVKINSSTPSGPNLTDGDYYGSSIANLGDLNGDGVFDIIVGSHLEFNKRRGGSSHIHFLNYDGSINSTEELNNITLGLNFDDNDFYGSSIANLGDLNLDGVIDLAIGAYGDDDGGIDRGAVYIHFMNSNGSVKSTTKINSDLVNGPTLENSYYYGSSIANLGDLDGDGINDIGVGAPGNGFGADPNGTVFIHFLTSGGGVKKTIEINSSIPSGPNLNDWDFYGSSIANLGDLDGDGITDIGVGAIYDAGAGSDRGAVHIHYLNSTLW